MYLLHIESIITRKLVSRSTKLYLLLIASSQLRIAPTRSSHLLANAFAATMTLSKLSLFPFNSQSILSAGWTMNPISWVSVLPAISRIGPSQWRHNLKSWSWIVDRRWVGTGNDLGNLTARSRSAYRDPGKKPQVQKSASRYSYFPATVPTWGTVWGYSVGEFYNVVN